VVKSEVFKIDTDDVLCSDTFLQELSPKHLKKRGFAAAAHTGNHLNKFLVFPGV
jgi:hypothetical protein